MSDSPAPSSPGPAADTRHGEAILARAIECRRAGKFTDAAALFAELIGSQRPTAPALLLMYGEALYRLGRLFAARDALHTCLAAAANPDAEFLLGRVLTGLGEPAAAVAAFERTLRLRGDHAAGWRFMAPPLWALDRVADAEAAFSHADELEPQPGEFYNELGIDLLRQRRMREAEAAFRRAIKLSPNVSAAHQNLGAALANQERLAEAIAAERDATRLAKNSAAAWNNLAVFAAAGGEFSEARHAVQRALDVDPSHADALNTLAQVRLEEGDARAALDLRRRVLKLNPEHRAAGASLLMDANYVGGEPAPKTFAAAKSFAIRLRPDGPPFDFAGHDRDPERRLRIGYVSADFRQHSCASFILPLFGAHDRAAVEIVAYSDNPLDDDVTAAMRPHATAWRDIAGLGDSAVAELIRSDRVDILIDLSGYTAGHRLPVFALKPAPIQATWLGYPNTTGLDTIDYRLTDARADPPGAEEFYSETLWRLPECFLAYGGPAAALGERGGGRPLTFGSFNHLPKVTPEVIAAWSRILAATPGSRLMMKAKRLGEGSVRARYARLFADNGIAAERLEMIGWQTKPSDHLALYGEIDIALDPFPYNGTTTTCEALWMGVPVITLAGDRHAGRVGASLLGAIGLDRLVAKSEAAYIDRALSLAQDRDEVTALHQRLRMQMAGSPLCDAAGFARRMEAAFREMWRRWCRAARA